MEVTDRQHLRRLRELPQLFLPELSPPVESRTQKAECVDRHCLVLLVKVVAPQAHTLSEPALETSRRISYVIGHGTQS